MARIRTHVPNAPISEAVIDIQVLPESIQLENVKRLTENTLGYEFVAPIFQIETAWAIKRKEGPAHRSQSQEIGVRLQSADKKYVLQPRTSGMSLSRLEPYEDWERLVIEAKRQWLAFSNAVRPGSVCRVATRFINKLKLPMKPGEHFEEYLTKPPGIPPDLPQGVLGFIQQMVLPKPDIGARANVTLTLAEGPFPADHIPVLLDIDVYNSVDMPAESDDIWNLLEKLRVFKNEIFFANITEKTAKLYE